MDKTDIKILNILQKNCKITIKDMGQQVSLTSPAVTERIHRMEDQGIIKGYQALINEIPLGKNVSAFVSISVEPSNYGAFCHFCEDSPLVIEHHHIIGVYNSLLRVAVSDSSELELFLEKLRTYGISQTSVLLSTYFTHKDFK